jgi:hypothetical protein
VVRISRVERPPVQRREVIIDEGTTLVVEWDGSEFRFKHGDVVVGRVSGDFSEICVVVKEYKICFAKSELEEMFTGGE